MLLNRVFVLMFGEFLNVLKEFEFVFDDVLFFLFEVVVDVGCVIFGKFENKIICFFLWFCEFFCFFFEGNVF